LGEIGPAAREAAPDLTAALQDPVRFVRVWAAAALARVAPSGGEAVGVLVANMKDEAAFVRSLAAWHLGRLGPAFPGIEQALIPLQQLEGDKDPSVAAEAALALGLLQGKGAPPELKSLSRES
jgi:HEAT repeat protein